MILYQDCSSHLDLSKNMAARGRGLFSLYIYIDYHHHIHFKAVFRLPRVGLVWQVFLWDVLSTQNGSGNQQSPFPASFCRPSIFLSETMDRFQYNFAEMFLWWSSTKIVQAIWIRQKIWLPAGGAYFPYISVQKTLKIFLSETTGPISI